MRVIVVGAGILGLSIAYNLAKCGAEVHVIESKYPGSGVSVRAIGGVHSQWANEHDIKLAMRNREVLEELSSELDFNLLFRRDGYLKIATDAESLANLESQAKLQRSVGLDTTLLTPKDIESQYPYLEASSLAGGVLSKGDGSAHPFSVVNGYWAGLEAHGGKMIRSTTVKGLNEKSGEISVIETDRGTYDADVYVLAAGAGTAEILRPLGLEVPAKLMKHEMLATEPLRFFLQPMVEVSPEHAYVTQSLRGEIVCEIPMKGHQTQPDTSSTLDFLEEAADELIKLIPALREVKVLRPWAGLIETTPDQEPVVGRSNYNNLWLAFADSGKGVMFSHVIGRMLAEEIISEQPDSDLKPYSPARFT